MNATYYYNSHRKNINFDNYASKKGTRVAVFPTKAKSEFLNTESTSSLDLILAFFCSAEFILIAKIVFGLLALTGFFSILCGISSGSISLVMGCICITLIVLLEYVIESEKHSL